MVKIITDSASDFEPNELKELMIDCIPLSVNFGDEEYKDNVTISKDEFFDKLKNTTETVKTSQPSQIPHKCKKCASYFLTYTLYFTSSYGQSSQLRYIVCVSDCVCANKAAKAQSEELVYLRTGRVSGCS